MKISVNWLSDYVELPKDVRELAARLTFAGLEVEGVEEPGKALDGVVVAKILEAEQHPNADKLKVTKVDAGGKAPLQIVCGAKNYKVGDLVPLATVGTTLPGGMTIKQAALRGVDSSGMLCSEKELGLADDASGLMILDPSLVPGTPLAKALNRDDVVLEVNVTPNRADALSHLGVAREVATLLGVALKKPKPKLAEAGEPASKAIAIRIEDKERCWRYAARVVEGVQVKPSPAWMKERLEAAGVRAINNLVDVTNYVLLEYGQPLHAFDLDQIGGAQIVVRTAKGGEKLTTLDDKERALDAEDLLICDKSNPLVLAGVMGGASSEVTQKTTRVLLECATFQPTTVRKSARRHALHTESSHRFERGTDVEIVPEVLDRAAALIAELGGGTVRPGIVDAYPEKKPRKTVELRAQKLEDLLGVAVPLADAERILTTLGFTKKSGDAKASTWEVPGWRVDVSIEEDLVEEVARIRGYDAIPLALPRGLSKLEPPRPSAIVEARLRAAMAGQGLDEVVNYSFVAPADLEAFGAGKDAITITNPLSVEQSVMRTSLFPSLVRNVTLSYRHQAQGVRFYELARSYLPDEKGGEGTWPVAKEKTELAGVLWGLRDGAPSWTAKDARVDFYDARAAVDAVLSALGIEGALYEPLESPWYHPRAAAVVRKGDVILGTVGEVHPKAQRALDAPPGVFAFQLDVEALTQAAALVPKATPIPRFPSVLRDLAVVVPVQMAADAVRDVIVEVGKPLVSEAQVFDVYTGPQVGEGKKNIAFALTYTASDRTLTDQEVATAHAKIVAEVTGRLGGALRS